MPQIIKIPPSQRVRIVGHEMQVEVAAAQYLFVLVLRKRQRLRPAWALPREPGARAQCVADQALELGDAVYWNGTFVEEGGRDQDVPAFVGSDQPVNLGLELARANFRQIAHGMAL